MCEWLKFGTFFKFPWIGRIYAWFFKHCRNHHSDSYANHVLHWRYQQNEAETRWPTICGRQFQTCFFFFWNANISNSVQTIDNINDGFGDGLTPNRWQAPTWTIDGRIYLFIYVSLGPNMLVNLMRLSCYATGRPVIRFKWRHNERNGVSNHRRLDCLLNRLLRRRSKKTSKLRVTGLWGGIYLWPVIAPHKGLVTRKMFPFDDVIMEIIRMTMYLVYPKLHQFGRDNNSDNPQKSSCRAFSKRCLCVVST